MSNTIPFIKPKEIDLKCSFCDAPKSKSTHFFSSGKGHHICGSCAAHAKQRLEESK